MAVTKSTLAPIKSTPVLWIRALMFLCSQELGWAHSQPMSQVDVYTKGKGASAEVVTLSWGNSQLAGYSHSKGGKPVTTAEGKVNAKLQRAQTALGKPMEVTTKWAGITTKHKTQLAELGLATFKEVPLAQA